MFYASLIPFGLIIIHFAWSVHKFTSFNRLTAKVLMASWREKRVITWKYRPLLYSYVNSSTINQRLAYGSWGQWISGASWSLIGLFVLSQNFLLWFWKGAYPAFCFLLWLVKSRMLRGFGGSGGSFSIFFISVALAFSNTNNCLLPLGIQLWCTYILYIFKILGTRPNCQLCWSCSCFVREKKSLSRKMVSFTYFLYSLDYSYINCSFI